MKKLVLFLTFMVLSVSAFANTNLVANLEAEATGYISSALGMVTSIVLAGVGLVGILWIARKARGGIRAA